MKAAWDLGINTIDTANFYSNGESERLVAKFMKKVPIILLPVYPILIVPR
jgi:aryl-alcohol dehydrogenase-like predicted oxidoreductase